MATPFVKFIQRWRVFSGFVIGAVYLVFARPGSWSLTLGLGIAVCGLALRAWACGHLRKARELDTSGPYAYTRNPLYLGTFLVAAGAGIASGVWWLVLLIVTYVVSIYFPVMHVEAEELESWAGEEYRDYARHVPLLLPRLTPWKKSERKFDFQLYLKNGEYNAAFGLLAAAAVLVFKAYYLS